MNFKLIATATALIAVSIIAMPSIVLADNGKGATKSNSNVVVQPGSVSNYTKSYTSITAASQPIVPAKQVTILTKSTPIAQTITPYTSTSQNTKTPAYVTAAQTAKQVACTTVKAYDTANTVIGCAATAASIACLAAGPASGFADTVPCAPIYWYTSQKGGMDCVNGIASAVIGKNYDAAMFTYQPSLTGGINAMGICDSPKSRGKSR